MILRRTTSKIVNSSGRTGRSYAGTAATAAASVNKNENEISEANNAHLSSASEEAQPNLKLKGKKLPKAQRKAMVEAFVHKYKAMNDGKLPSVSNVVKQVGGSYYVVKKIVQEVESQLKLSAVNNANQNAFGKEMIKEDEYLFKAKKVSKAESDNISVNVDVQNDFQMEFTNRVEINDASDKHVEAERGSKSSSSAEKTFPIEEVVNIDCYSEFAAAQNSLRDGDAEKIVGSSIKKVDMKEVENSVSDFVEVPSNLLQEKFENVSHPCHINSENGRQHEAWAQGEIPVFVAEENDLRMMNSKKFSHQDNYNAEDNKQKKVASEDLHGEDVSKDKSERLEETPEHKPAVDNSCRQTSEAELPKKSTLWGNMKSFADGIFNFWRKP